jgi:hypothetical protein
MSIGVEPRPGWFPRVVDYTLVDGHFEATTGGELASKLAALPRGTHQRKLVTGGSQKVPIRVEVVSGRLYTACVMVSFSSAIDVTSAEWAAAPVVCRRVQAEPEYLAQSVTLPGPRDSE